MVDEIIFIKFKHNLTHLLCKFTLNKPIISLSVNKGVNVKTTIQKKVSKVINNNKITRAIPIQYDVTFLPTIGSEQELVEAAYVAALSDTSYMGELILNASLKKLKAFKNESSLIKKVLKKNRKVKEGAFEIVDSWVHLLGGKIHNPVRHIVEQVKAAGGIPIVVANDRIDLGVILIKGL